MTSEKPSNTEEEYFARENAERLRKLAAEQKAAMAAADREGLKQQHWMRCPKCGMEMHEVKLRGVDVDVCFSCEGVFLDRGELAHIEKPESRGVMSAILNWFKPETKGPA